MSVMKPVKKLTVSGIIMAVYIDLMYLAQILSLGQIRIRIADCAYILSYVYSFLAIPLGLANFLYGLFFGGFGLIDAVGWAVVGIITSEGVNLVKRIGLSEWFTVIPVICIPSLLAPLWLSPILHLPYVVLTVSISIGQIVPACMGVFLLKKLKNLLPEH